jgi:hypothetical protein
VLDTNTSEYQGSHTMRVAQKEISHVFPAGNRYSKVMKVIRMEVRFVSKLYFSTKSLPTCTALRK